MKRPTNWLRVMTLNARSIRTHPRLTGLERNMAKIKFNILGISEIQRTGREYIKLGSGYSLYSSGNIEGAPHASAGVAFYVNQALDKAIEGARYTSNKIVQMTFKQKGGRKLRVTQVYAPHTGHSDDDYDAFLEDLAQALENNCTHELVIGDFNAIIGKRQPGEFKNCGNFCFGTRKDRGEVLINIAFV